MALLVVANLRHTIFLKALIAMAVNGADPTVAGLRSSRPPRFSGTGKLAVDCRRNRKFDCRRRSWIRSSYRNLWSTISTQEIG